MAQRKIKTSWEAPEQPAQPVQTAMDATLAAPSPARMLQRMLEERSLEQAQPGVAKWSQRRALAFIVTSAAALWMALLVAGAEAAKALA